MSKQRRDKTTPPRQNTERAEVKPPSALGEALSRAGLGPTTLATWIRWIEGDFCADQYAGLEDAQDASDGALALAQVFVDLEVSPQSEPDASNAAKKALPGFVELVLQEKPRPFGFAIAEAGLSQGFALIGGPGQGKSTLGQFLAQIHRAELLEPHRDNLTKSGREALDLLLAQRPAKLRPTMKALPLRVILRDLADFLAREGGAGEGPVMWRYLLRQSERTLEGAKTEARLKLEELQALVQHCPVLLILDGLDEVPLSAGRDSVLQAIQAFLGWLSERGATGLAMATTRPQGYADECTALQLRPQYLVPLSPERALAYADGLVKARFAGRPDKQRKIMERMEQAAKEEGTARLLRSPLQVTLMAVLVHRIGRAPSERWNLFHDYYRVMYERELERHGSVAEVLRTHRAYIDRIHARVGLLLQVQSEAEGGAAALMSREQLDAVVDATLAEDLVERSQREMLVRTIREAAEHRLVFLVQPQKDRYGFEIRSLQEFMAAVALTDKKDDIVEARLRQIAPATSFRNVFLFAASKSFAELSDLRDAISMRICPGLSDAAEDECGTLTLAGSRLALELLEDGAALGQPRHALALMGLAVRLLERPGSHIHHRLARVGEEPSLGEVLRAALLRRLALPSAAERLSAWVTLNALIARGVEWARALGEERWPAEVEERRGIVWQVWRVSWHQPKECDWLRSMVRDEPTLVPPALMLIRATEHDPDWEWLSAARGVKMVPSFPPRGVQGALHVVSFFVPTQDAQRIASPLILAQEQLPSPEWALDVAMRAFLANPCAKTLADQLETLSRTPGWSRLVDDLLYGPRPWPLEACIKWCLPSQLGDLAARVRAGELGDIDDWHAAEQRWKTQGIRVSDFEPEENLPFDRHIAVRGFPALGAGLMLLMGESVKELFEALGHVRHPRHLLEALRFSDVLIRDIAIPKELLSPSRFRDPATRAQAASLRVSQGFATPHEVNAIVDDVLATNARRDLAFLLNAARSRHLHRDVGKHLLLALRARIPQEDAELHADILSALDNVHGRHPSQLDDPAVWDALALPLPRPQSKPRPITPTEIPSRSPHIKNIQIENLRVFDSIAIPVEPPAEGEGQWLVLLGENGSGKSTILRAIALSLAEPAIATTLLTTSRAPWRRIKLRPEEAGTVAISTREGRFRLEIVKQIEQEIARPASASTPARPWLCAYGCARGSAIGGPDRDVPDESPVDAVATLFDESAKLVHAETWLKMRKLAALEDPNGPSAAVYETIIEVLKDLLEVERIEIRDDRVWVVGNRVGEAPLAALSDGYLTTAGWIIDLMARWIRHFERNAAEGEILPAKFHKEMTGLVLIDEIDLHLHPRWQCRIIEAIRSCFPKLSFIVTTHNPLTLLGARPGEVFVLRDESEEGEAPVVKARQADLPKGLRADQILTGPWFGLESTMDADTLALLAEHRRILRRRSPADEARKREVEEELRKRLGSFADTSVERIALSVAAELMDEDRRALSPEDRARLREEIKRRTKERDNQNAG